MPLNIDLKGRTGAFVIVVLVFAILGVADALTAADLYGHIAAFILGIGEELADIATKLVP